MIYLIFCLFYEDQAIFDEYCINNIFLKNDLRHKIYTHILINFTTKHVQYFIFFCSKKIFLCIFYSS